MSSKECRWPYVWWLRKWLPERKGQRCRVLARGRMGTILVEFDDGHRTTTNRFAVRKLPSMRIAKGRRAEQEETERAEGL